MLKKRIEQLLKSSQVYRDNDKELMLAVWQSEGLILTPLQKQKFLGCSSPESIRRCRQLFQQQGKYSATKRVDEQRFQRYRQVRYDPTSLF